MTNWISSEIACVGSIKGRFRNTEVKIPVKIIGKDSKWAFLSFQTQRDL